MDAKSQVKRRFNGIDSKPERLPGSEYELRRALVVIEITSDGRMPEINTEMR